MNHGSVVEGEESDDEPQQQLTNQPVNGEEESDDDAIASSPSAIDLSKPVHELFGAKAASGTHTPEVVTPASGGGGVVEGEEDEEPAASDTQPAAAAPSQPELSEKSPSPEAVQEAEVKPKVKRGRRRNFKDAMGDIHSGLYEEADDPIAKLSTAVAEAAAVTSASASPEASPTLPPAAPEVPSLGPSVVESTPSPSPAAEDPKPVSEGSFHGALVQYLDGKHPHEHRLVTPSAAPKPNIPLREPQSLDDTKAKLAARGEAGPEHHPLTHDLGDVVYETADSILDASVTIGFSVATNADEHRLHLAQARKHLGVSTDLGNLLAGAMDESTGAGHLPPLVKRLSRHKPF